MYFVCFFKIFAQIHHALCFDCLRQVKPLADSPLKNQIETMASQLKFPLKALYEMDGSARSSHSNAYQYVWQLFKCFCWFWCSKLIFFSFLKSTQGFFGSKHIVVYDTLIAQASTEEIVAIVGHELGHWNHSHTLQMFVISQLQVCVDSYLRVCRYILLWHIYVC